MSKNCDKKLETILSFLLTLFVDFGIIPNVLDKLNNVEEYVENNKEINNVIRMLVKYYHVPYDILAFLIDEVNEKVAMEYETSKT